MNQSNKYCAICGFAKKSRQMYKILEDVSMWDKNLIHAKKHYACEDCLVSS